MGLFTNIGKKVSEEKLASTLKKAKKITIGLGAIAAIATGITAINSMHTGTSFNGCKKADYGSKRSINRHGFF